MNIGDGDTSSFPSSVATPSRYRGGSMTDKEEKERRASIQAIMKDPSLTPHERRKSIQYLMDGRRSSSVFQPSIHNGDNMTSLGNGMATAAAMATEDYDSSSDEEVGSDYGARQKTAVSPQNKWDARGSYCNAADGKQDKRKFSLRESFALGFSEMGVKDSGADIDVCQPASAAMPPSAESNSLWRMMEKSRPPCSHYERNCSIVSPCCGLVVGCRICHDDHPALPPPLYSPQSGADHLVASMPVSAAAAAPMKAPTLSLNRSSSLPVNFTDDESQHEINRFLINQVICRECFTLQSSKTNNCVSCGIQFGSYHCAICNLWMSADEDPYHCKKCGFCRVGGRENFTHCDDCGMCIDAILFDDHNCKSGKYMSNCPVCQEDLFSSRMASHEMPCGHAIHWHCYRELTSHDTRCPVCKKTAETPDEMEETWGAMAVAIALQPVPADMARSVDILCNDCEEKCVNQRWHFLGVQCPSCNSFNTTVERTVLMGQEASDFLGPESDTAAQAQWAGVADRNLLSLLLGGEAAGIPSTGEDNMDASNRRISSSEEGDEMDQS